MSLSEEKYFSKIEICLNENADVFIQEEKQILQEGEVISSTTHRYAVNAADEQKLQQILGISGVAAKIAELTALLNNEQ